MPYTSVDIQTILDTKTRINATQFHDIVCTLMDEACSQEQPHIFEQLLGCVINTLAVDIAVNITAQEWLHMCEGAIYADRNCESSAMGDYWAALCTIFERNDCANLDALEDLLNQAWGEDEKLAIIAAGIPTI